MNGAGNDFVLIDNRARKIRLSRDQVVRLCDRHRGVGADGVLLLAEVENIAIGLGAVKDAIGAGEGLNQPVVLQVLVYIERI